MLLRSPVLGALPRKPSARVASLLFAAAGGEDVRGPAPVCLCCRGVCEGRAWGAAAAGAGGRLGGRVRLDKHFFAWTVAALPTLPEAPDRKRLVFLAGPLSFEGTWQVFPGKPGRTMTDRNGRPQMGLVWRTGGGNTGFCPHQHPILRIRCVKLACFAHRVLKFCTPCVKWGCFAHGEGCYRRGRWEAAREARSAARMHSRSAGSVQASRKRSQMSWTAAGAGWTRSSA